MNEQLSFAQSVVAKLNELMMRLPGYRIASHGTRISLEKANGHFYDAGLDAVSEFHRAFGIEQPAEPKLDAHHGTIYDIESYAIEAAKLGEELKVKAAKALENGDARGQVMLIRLQLIQEELAELADGMVNQDPVECLDALVDLSYVVDGSYLTLGLGAYKLSGLAEVHRSNMSKLGEDGRPILSEAGRVMKGSNYTPPDLKVVTGLVGPEEC